MSAAGSVTALQAEAAHLAVAQAGSPSEFGRLVEPYRRELLAYGYRLLGSPLDAEDLVQETLLRAWRGRASFNRVGSFRAWLYKIATNAGLNALARRPRRGLPPSRYPAGDPRQPMPAPLADPVWLEPLPDEWLPDPAPTPEARYSARESVSLAFLTALHLLPPRQRAVLLLREVLDWRAQETADLLGLTLAAVNSALHRARVTLAKHYPPAATAAPAIDDDAATQRLLARYVGAWETADVAGLVALLREDATFTMPPYPSWFQGRADIAAVLARGVFATPTVAGWQWRVLPTRANGHPALAIYRRAAAGAPYLPFTLQVLVLDAAGGQVTALVNFLNPALLACFGLPAALPAD